MMRKTGRFRSAAPFLAAIALCLLPAAPAHAGWVGRDYQPSATYDGPVALAGPGAFGTQTGKVVAAQLDPFNTTEQEKTFVFGLDGDHYRAQIAGSPFDASPSSSGATSGVLLEQLWTSGGAPYNSGSQIISAAGCAPWVADAGSPPAGGCLAPAGKTPNAAASIELDQNRWDSATGGRELLFRYPGNFATEEIENADCSENGLCLSRARSDGSGSPSETTLWSPVGLDTDPWWSPQFVCNDSPGGIEVADVNGDGWEDILHWGALCTRTQEGGQQRVRWDRQYWSEWQTGLELWLRTDDGSGPAFELVRVSTWQDELGPLRDVLAAEFDWSPGAEVVTLGVKGWRVYKWNSTLGMDELPLRDQQKMTGLGVGRSGQIVAADLRTSWSNTERPDGRADLVIASGGSTRVWTSGTGSSDVFGQYDWYTNVPTSQHPGLVEPDTVVQLYDGSERTVQGLGWPARGLLAVGDVDGNGRDDFFSHADVNANSERTGQKFVTSLQTEFPGLAITINGRGPDTTTGTSGGWPLFHIPADQDLKVKATPLKPGVDGEGMRHQWNLSSAPGYEVDTTEAEITRSFERLGEPFLASVLAQNRGQDAGSIPFYVETSDAFTGSFTATPRGDDGVSRPGVGDEVTFTASADGGWPLDGGGYGYQWFIDGVAGPTTKSFTKKYDEAGRHTFSVRIIDKYGNVAVQPANQTGSAVTWAGPLVADLRAGRADDVTIQPMVGERIKLSAEGTSGGIRPYKYEFDEGSGYGAQGTSATLTRSADETTAGPKTFRVRVTDADQKTATDEVTVTVLAKFVPGLEASKSRPAPGETVTFDASAPSSGGERPYTYAWKVDGQTRTDPTPGDGRLDVSWPDPDPEATVSVVVTDDAGRTHADPVVRTVRVAAPVDPRITATPAKPDEGEATVLSAAGTTGGLGPLEYAWDLDDDGTYELDRGTDPTLPARSFAQAGDYDIAVRVTEADDQTTIGHLTLSVYEPLSPQIAQTPTVARPDQEVTFDAAATNPGGLGPYRYAWSIDGEPVAGQTAATLKHTFPDAGEYDVKVDVTDARNRSAAATKALKVAADLDAGITLDNTSPQVGETVTLTSSTQGGLEPYTYDWDLDGDGTTDEAAGHGSTATKTLTAPGEHTVRLEVTDADDVTDEATITFEVARKLTAAFTVSPQQPGVGQQVTFTSSASGGHPDYEYRWYVDDSDTPESATTPTFQRTFQAGEHTVELRVTDARDRTVTHSETFKVADPLVAGFTRNNESPQVGETLTLTSSTQGGIGPYTYDWDLDGDGTTDEGAGHASTASLPLTETGEHTVKLKVTDADDVTDDFTMTFEVASQLDASFTVNPRQAGVDQPVTFTSSVDGGTPGYTYAWYVDDSETPEPQTTATLERGFAAGRHTVELKVTDARNRTTTHSESFKVADPLVAGFTRDNESPQVGETLTLTSSTQGGLAPYTYDWDLDGNGTTDEAAGHAATATLPLTSTGSHTVKLKVTDGDRVEDDFTMTFSVAKRLTAALTVDPAHQAVGEPVSFTSTVDGGTPGYSYAWFLDGSNTPEAQNTATLQRTFGTPGRHTMKLRVTDARNRVVTTDAKSFKVADELQADFTPDNQSPQAGEAVTLTADVAGGLEPYTYDWDLDNDGTTDEGAGHGAQATKTFDAEGTYPVTLKVTDDDEVVDEVTVPIVVGGALAARFVVTPAQPGVGRPVTFDAGTTGGGKPGYTYEWFLDRSETPEQERTATLQRTFAQPGKHKVKLRVTDSQDRVSTTEEQTFKVADPLVAGFDPSNATPQAGETITLTSSTTGGLGPYTYDWDLNNDGTTDESAGHAATTSLSLPEHGTRSVTLTITDADNVKDDVTVPIEVSRPLTAQFARDPQQAAVGQKVTLDGTSTFGGTEPYAKYEWFVDGAATPLAETTATVQRSFAAGRHTVKLRVTDKQNRTSETEEQRFKVVDPLVAAITRSNPSPQVGETITLTSATQGGLEPYKYGWDLDNDGTVDEAAGSNATATMTLARNGEHTVRLVVTDDDSVVDDATMTFNVSRALTAQFVRDPQAAAVGQLVTLDATSTFGGTRPYAKYEWFVDDATTPLEDTTATVQRRFAAGRHSVELRVTDARNRTSTAAKQSFKVADPLVAGFERSNQAPQVGETLRFTSTTQGGLEPYRYGWDLDGDGNVDEAAGADDEATLLLRRSGEHTVKLVVTDDDQVVDDATMTFVVSPALTARFERRPQQPAVGQKVTFDAAPTTGGQRAYKKYEWFLDGSATPEAQTTETLERTFNAPGRHKVKLRVTDAQDRTSVADEQTFKVANELVAGLIATPPVPDRDESVTLDAAAAGGLPPFTYAFDLDGSAETGPAGFETGPSEATRVSRSFATTGRRTLRVEVTDADDVTDIQTVDVRVVDPLVAATTIAPAEPRPGQEVVLTASGTSGGLQPFGYDWMLDDEPFGGDSAEIRRTYAEPGIHTAKLTVRDSRNRSDEAERTFKVADPLTAGLSFTPPRPQAGEQVTFTGARTGGLPGFRYAFDLDGDGELGELGDANTATTTYETPGERRASLRVVDSDGVEATASVPVQVADTLVARLTARPSLLPPGGETTFDASASKGGAGAHTFRWDLDGQPGYEVDGGSTPTLKQTYPGQGIFEVGVQVSDAAGHTASEKTTVDVGERLRVRLTPSTETPVVGGPPVTLTATASPDAPTRYRFDTDGNPGWDTPFSTSPTAEARPTRGGQMVVGVEAQDDRGQTAVAQAVLEVAGPLVAEFTTKPEKLEEGEETEFNAARSSGGTAPRRYAWDFDGDGTYERDTGSKPFALKTFDRMGPVEIGLKVTDALGREAVSRRGFDVKDGCRRSVVVGLARFSTTSETGCFRKGGPREDPHYWTRDDVEMNNLPIALPGDTKLTIGYKTMKVIADAGVVEIQGRKIFDAKVEWHLPRGGDADAADEGQLFGGGGMAGEAKLFGLKAEGAFRLTLGRTAREGDNPPEHYVKLRVDLAIPGVALGPYHDSPGATARAQVKWDHRGFGADAVYFQLQQGFLPASGGIKINNLCLSYRKAGYIQPEEAEDGTVLPNPTGLMGALVGDDITPTDETQEQIQGCAQFDAHDGSEFLTCEVDPDVDNWNGTLELEVADYGFDAAVGIGGGQLSNMSLRANLGDAAQIMPDVFVRSLAAGVCLRPAPLQVKGEVVVGALPVDAIGEDFISVAGGFYYRGPEPAKKKPWRGEIYGNGKLLGALPIAKAHLGVDGDAVLDVAIEPQLRFPSGGELVNTKGRVAGFLEGKTGRFNLEGDVEVCIASVFCDGGTEALVSSTGAAACKTLFTIWNPFGSNYRFRAGFGAKWGGWPSIMVESCGIGDWRVSRSATARAAQAGFSGRQITVGKDEPALTVRARGAGAPPNAILRGPDGTVITSTDIPVIARDEGKWMVYKDAQAAATQFQVYKPAPGKWTIESAGIDPIVGIDTAEDIPAPHIEAKVKKGRGRARTLEYLYQEQKDTRIEFYEVDEKGMSTKRTLGVAKPGRCAKAHESGLPAKCGTIRFQPTYGPGGARAIKALVIRGDRVDEDRKVLTYTAPPPETAGKVRGLEIARGKKGVSVRYRRAPGASRVEMAVVVDDSYRKLLTLKPNQRRVRLPRIPKTSGMLVEVTGYDERDMPGKRARLRLKARRSHAGAYNVRR